MNLLGCVPARACAIAYISRNGIALLYLFHKFTSSGRTPFSDIQLCDCKVTSLNFVTQKGICLKSFIFMQLPMFIFKKESKEKTRDLTWNDS